MRFYDLSHLIAKAFLVALALPSNPGHNLTLVAALSPELGLIYYELLEQPLNSQRFGVFVQNLTRILSLGGYLFPCHITINSHQVAFISNVICGCLGQSTCAFPIDVAIHVATVWTLSLIPCAIFSTTECNRGDVLLC